MQHRHCQLHIYFRHPSQRCGESQLHSDVPYPPFWLQDSQEEEDRQRVPGWSGAYLRLQDQAHELLKGTTARTGPHRCTLVSDGWTHIRGESIVNHVLVSPEGQALFHSSDPTGDNSHTGEYLASELMRVIKSVGAKNIIAICTGTDSNMLSAVRSVVATNRHIHPVRCTSQPCRRGSSGGWLYQESLELGCRRGAMVQESRHPFESSQRGDEEALRQQESYAHASRIDTMAIEA